jgi:hypothetical protein|tara:strand:+ start:311 stop:691 length:381 start_codon:yes stop_codon:yes gene_type:complete
MTTSTYEAFARLYSIRYGRLAPGKDIPQMMMDNFTESQNRDQYNDWHQSGLAAVDAIHEVAKLSAEVMRLADERDELRSLIDDIDTATDIHKPDNEHPFTKVVYQKIGEANQILGCFDGLTWSRPQ